MDHYKAALGGCVACLGDATSNGGLLGDCTCAAPVLKTNSSYNASTGCGERPEVMARFGCFLAAQHVRECCCSQCIQCAGCVANSAMRVRCAVCKLA